MQQPPKFTSKGSADGTFLWIAGVNKTLSVQLRLDVEPLAVGVNWLDVRPDRCGSSGLRAGLQSGLRAGSQHPRYGHVLLAGRKFSPYNSSEVLIGH